MKHQVGDLLWIPQMAMLYKGPNSPMAVKFNDEPKIGLFLKETSHEGFLCISVDGETWIIEEKHTRRLKGVKENVG